jgi:serine/threonine protein kinase/tetratricopeptide (TPR) repeat protein
MQTGIGSSRFKIVRRLGEGGMGTVYEALETERGERVAMKVLRKASPDSIVRFKREFRALQDIHHPNLVTLRELVSEGDEWFFTMELVDGEDFVSWVTTMPDSLPPSGSRATVGPPPAKSPFSFNEKRLRGALAQLAQGLAALHDAKKVHRDVKPSNVLVEPGGRLVVLDFGLVAEVQEHGSQATDLDVVGTPAYMAPEQAASRAVGPAADWYSVGCLLYEAMTGQVPFQGAPLAVLLRKQKDEPKPAGEIAPGLPKDLDELCTRMLRFDPGARPTDREVLRALDALPARGEAASIPSVTMSLGVPFVGRERELDLLRRSFETTRSGHAVSVLVHGESGIGKSCLVKHFTEAVASQDRELLLLTGRCYERETVPYKALDGIVDSLARFLTKLPASEVAHYLPTRPGSLVQVFPVLRRVEAIAQGRGADEPVADPHELRARAFNAMRELFARVTNARALILVIDDLQWADADSFAALHEILRGPDEPNLLLVATIRDDASTTGSVRPDADGAPRTTERASARARERIAALPGEVHNVRLERLGKEDARALAARLVERLAPGIPVHIDSLATEADGHPLFIDEIVRHVFLVGATQGALKLEDALWSRIASLEDVPRRIVEVCAIAGSPLPQDAVGKAVETSPADFSKLVSFLRVAHLVRTTGTRGNDVIECFHGRVREAVLSHLSPAARKKHHLRLAVALESSPNADADLLAIHWLGAGDMENAGKHMLVAADRASAALAFERAARMYERARELRSQGPTKLPRAEESALLTKLGDALANAGRGEQAAHAYRDAAVGANAAEGLDLRRRAADYLLRSGHFDVGLDATEEVLASVRMTLPRTPWRTLIALVWWRLLLAFRGFGYTLTDASHTSARDLMRIDVCYAVAFSLSLVDPICGQLFQTRNILFSLRAGEPQRVARALAIEVGYRGMGGGPAWKRTRALDEDARKLAREVGTPGAVAWSLATSGVAHYLSGRFTEALAICDEAEPIFVEQCAGAFWEIAVMRLFALQALGHLGRLGELRTRQARALRAATGHGDLYAVVNFRIGNPNLAWLVDGDPARARGEALDAMSAWSKRGFHIEHYYELMALTNADLYEGNGREAHDRVTTRLAVMRRSFLSRVQMVRITGSLLRGRTALAAALETKGTERSRLLARAEESAQRMAMEQMPWATPLSGLILAGVAHLRGDTSRAISVLERAVLDADAGKLGLVAASARHALGVCKGGDEGTRLRGDAFDAVAREGAKDPASLVAMTAPGFAR